MIGHSTSISKTRKPSLVTNFSLKTLPNIFDSTIRDALRVKEMELRIRDSSTRADTAFDYHDGKTTIESQDTEEYSVLNLGN